MWKSPVAPDEGVDWAFAASMVVLVAVVTGNVVLPALVLRPVLYAAAELGDEETSGEAPQPPAMLWPVLCAAGGLAVVVIAVRRLVRERELGRRWLWVLAAGGASALWSLMTLAALARAHAMVSRLTNGL